LGLANCLKTYKKSDFYIECENPTYCPNPSAIYVDKSKGNLLVFCEDSLPPWSQNLTATLLFAKFVRECGGNQVDVTVLMQYLYSGIPFGDSHIILPAPFSGSFERMCKEGLHYHERGIGLLLSGGSLFRGGQYVLWSPSTGEADVINLSPMGPNVGGYIFELNASWRFDCAAAGFP